MVNKKGKKAVVLHVGIPSDSNIRKKDHETLEKCQRAGKKWQVKTSVYLVIGALGAVTTKPGEWQIPG